ncbi:hypothetical protein BC826DRAFT_326096 [Russula brevipes]|nr:hypothetical protein BC826DRAFT_326096 [Russula brevipes]
MRKHKRMLWEVKTEKEVPTSHLSASAWNFGLPVGDRDVQACFVHALPNSLAIESSHVHRGEMRSKKWPRDSCTERNSRDAPRFVYRFTTVPKVVDQPRQPKNTFIGELEMLVTTKHPNQRYDTNNAASQSQMLFQRKGKQTTVSMMVSTVLNPLESSDVERGRKFAKRFRLLWKQRVTSCVRTYCNQTTNNSKRERRTEGGMRDMLADNDSEREDE